LHLLCHSMGNYALQCALERLSDHTPGYTFPRLFAHIFMCAADVDDNALEEGEPLGDIHELAHYVTVYCNKGDVAVFISHYTKAHPERLGHGGPARPTLVHNKIHTVNCSGIVGGFVEHSYYQDGRVNQDIRYSIAGLEFDHPLRQRARDRDLPGVWTMT
jgi:esterase/lipase superfamily enzyme